MLPQVPIIIVDEQEQWIFIFLNLGEAADCLEEAIVDVVVIRQGNLTH